MRFFLLKGIFISFWLQGLHVMFYVSLVNCHVEVMILLPNFSISNLRSGFKEMGTLGLIPRFEIFKRITKVLRFLDFPLYDSTYDHDSELSNGLCNMKMGIKLSKFDLLQEALIGIFYVCCWEMFGEL
jgi:hypothetical protein